MPKKGRVPPQLRAYLFKKGKKSNPRSKRKGRKAVAGRARDSQGRLLPKGSHGPTRRKKGGSRGSHLAAYQYRKSSPSGTFILQENPKKRRNGPRKGVVPAALRPYLFRKGHR